MDQIGMKRGKIEEKIWEKSPKKFTFTGWI